MDKNDKFECDTCDVEEPHSHSISERILAGLKYAFVEFLDDITIQLIVGIVIAGLISFLIPDNFFADFGGEGFVGMLMMIAVGIPLYVCATASIPIAVSLILKGISPGAAFVFLVVGPATNAATIALISKTLGKKLIVIYLTVIAVFAILGGYLLNYIFGMFGTSKMMLMDHHNEISLFSTLLLAAFSILMVLSLYRKIRSRNKKPELGNELPIKTFLVEGMTCNHCAANVKNSLSTIDGVEDVRINLEKKNVVVDGNYDKIEIKTAIEKAGYKVVG